MLAAAYDYVATTEPFCRWNLPESDEVRFYVISSPADFARYRWDGKRHTISVSSRSVGHTATLIEKMCHEVIHLHLEETGMESLQGTTNTHNHAFRKLALGVCKSHGFDPKSFW